MPFGLTNAPATFQCLMNCIFGPYMRKFVLVFMDDILIYSKSLEEHVHHLKLVFQILLDHKLFLKFEKCAFAQQQIEYLGHIISDKGVATDPTKTTAVQQWPVPQNFTELRGFLGLTGYYRKFVQSYGIIAKPLTSILKMKQFTWTAAAQQAFETLKAALSSTPVLTLPNFECPFEIDTDACDTGVGAVLSQNGHPVAYFSKALSATNQKLSTYEKEFLALLMAVDKWRPYLLKKPFIIRTDHQSLCHLQDQTLSTDMQRKAMAKLAGLSFTIHYKKGQDNKVANALSRVGSSVTLSAIFGSTPVWIQEVVNSYVVDPKAQQLLIELAVVSPNTSGYSLPDGLIRYKKKIWVGSNTALQTKIIHAFHASAIGGHSGSKATYHRIKKLFHWPGLKTVVEDFIKQCTICQQAKHELCQTPGLLSPLPIPDGPWRDVSMDFIEALPKMNGYSVILVVVDRFTKYAHFLPVKHPFTAVSIARLFFDNIVKLHGLPHSIVSNRDRVFTSSFRQELFALLKTELLLSSAYHPQTDGQIERVNQCLEMFLRCSVSESPKQWLHWHPLAELWYNTSYHSAIKCSPYKAFMELNPTWELHLSYTRLQQLKWLTHWQKDNCSLNF